MNKSLLIYYNITQKIMSFLLLIILFITYLIEKTKNRRIEIQIKSLIKTDLASSDNKE